MGEGDGGAEYELVIPAEQQIEFLSTEMVAGNITADGTVPPAPKPSVKESLAEVRRSLPVFPYREDILAAVGEYQVRGKVGGRERGKRILSVSGGSVCLKTAGGYRVKREGGGGSGWRLLVCV